MQEPKVLNKVFFVILVICAALLTIGTFIYIGYLYDREVPVRSKQAINFIKEHKAPLGIGIESALTESEKLMEKKVPTNFKWNAERKPFSYQMYKVTLTYEVGEEAKKCEWMVDTNKMRSGDYNECAKMITLLEDDKEKK